MITFNSINHALLIDDDEVANFLNKKVIQKAGGIKNVTVATDGEKALESISRICAEENQCPELIFLDLNMPVMSGFEFLEKYEELQLPNKDKVRIVILTSSFNPEDMKKIKEKNLPFITKPLTEKIIGELLEKKS